jgi:H+/Cl- antiporter ClcA
MKDLSFPTSASENLGDYTVSPRMLTIAIFALGIGVVSAFIALGLLQLIGLCTNIFFYQRLAFAPVSPVGHHLGLFVVVVPIIGAVIIGLMARYGSERIRGHGIPEAIEAILLNGSRVEPKLALLKPLSAAISIGSGGPFGAEGPIIMTGGAFGSMVAQLFHLTSTERKTLLVAGAAGEMRPPLPRQLRPCCSRLSCCSLNGGNAGNQPAAPRLRASLGAHCRGSVRALATPGF